MKFSIEIKYLASGDISMLGWGKAGWKYTLVWLDSDGKVCTDSRGGFAEKYLASNAAEAHAKEIALSLAPPLVYTYTPLTEEEGKNEDA